MTSNLAMTTNPAVERVENTRAFEPRSIQEGLELAKVYVASGLLPRAVARPEAAFLLIATGRELGLSALMSIRGIHIIEGKPTLAAEAIAALVQSSPICSYFRLVENTDRVARFETLRRGHPAPTSLAYTIEDAQRAGLVQKDNWRKHPAAMLRARATTALARAVYPDLVLGLYTDEEIQSEPPSAGEAPSAGVSISTSTSSTPSPAVANGPSSEARALGFESLAARLDAASTRPEINAVAISCKRSHAAGEITDGQLAALRAAVARRRESIVAAEATTRTRYVEPEPDAYATTDEATRPIPVATEEGAA